MATASQEIDPAIEAHRLVLRFLNHQGYHDAASALQREAARSNPRILQRILAPVSSSGDPGYDWQDVVDDFVAARLARCKVDDPTATLKEQLEALELDEHELPQGEVRTAIRDASNVLCVQRASVPRREWDSQQLRFVV